MTEFFTPPGHDLMNQPEESSYKAAGVAVIAMDTGRVLMQQRALSPLLCPQCDTEVNFDELDGWQHGDGSINCWDNSGSTAGEACGEPPDENEGTWEFPGGKLDPGETPRAAAVREFEEEIGQPLPPGVFVSAWDSGPTGSMVVTSDLKRTLTPAQEFEQRYPTRRVNDYPQYPEGYLTWKDTEFPITEKDSYRGLDQPMVGFRDNFPPSIDSSSKLYQYREDEPVCQQCYDEGRLPTTEHDHENMRHTFKPLLPEPGERRFGAYQSMKLSPFGDQADFKANGWRQKYSDTLGYWEKEGLGYYHEAFYDEDDSSPYGYSWRLNSFAGGELIGGDEKGDYGSSRHLDATGVMNMARYREKQWIQKGLSDEKFKPPMSQRRPTMIPSEDDRFERWRAERNLQGAKPFSAVDMNLSHPFHPIQRHNATEGPVYKGFIYLIQAEDLIDLGKREIANPDDPDGDRTEQAAWWEIEHAKENPALREEVKTVPWEELEIWADKSVRSNREVVSMFRLATSPEEHSKIIEDGWEPFRDTAYEREIGEEPPPMWIRATERPLGGVTHHVLMENERPDGIGWLLRVGTLNSQTGEFDYHPNHEANTFGDFNSLDEVLAHSRVLEVPTKSFSVTPTRERSTEVKTHPRPFGPPGGSPPNKRAKTEPDFDWIVDG